MAEFIFLLFCQPGYEFIFKILSACYIRNLIASRAITSKKMRCAKEVLKKFCIFFAFTQVNDLLKKISFSGKKMRCWAFQSADRYLTKRKYFIKRDTFIKIKNSDCALKSKRIQFIDIGIYNQLNE